jgi:hypothetical protein
LDDLFRFREAAFPALRKYHLAVNQDIEAVKLAGLQLYLQVEGFLDFFRQPGGFGFVRSRSAVPNYDMYIPRAIRCTVLSFAARESGGHSQKQKQQ